MRDILNVTLDGLIVNESKNEDIIELSKLYTNNNIDYHKDDEKEELSYNLMIGGLIIGISIGFITDNYMWVIDGSLIGIGIGYILEYI